MSNPLATWSISLDAECPSCAASVNLIDLDSFRDSGTQPLETAKNVEVRCPFCKHEFIVDLEY